MHQNENIKAKSMFETYAALQKYGDKIKDQQYLSKFFKEKQ